jgi:hypothetical protein
MSGAPPLAALARHPELLGAKSFRSIADELSKARVALAAR